MSITRTVFSGGVQLSVANGIARGLGIVSLPLLTQWIAPASYGQAALASTLVSFSSVVALMGMDMSYSRGYLSRTKPNGAAVEGFCWRFAMVAAFVAAIVSATVWIYYSGTSSGAIPGLAVWIAVGSASSLLFAMAQTRSRLLGQIRRLSLAVAVGGIIATAITILLAWHTVRNEIALVSGYVAAFVVSLTILGLPSWRQLIAKPAMTRSERKTVFLFGLPGVMSAPMYWVVSSSDRWFIEHFSSAADLGVYAIAGSLGTIGMLMNAAVIAIWIPESTRLHESGEDSSNRELGQIMALLLLAMAIVWLSVVSVGGELLRLLTDSKFHSAERYLPWISGGVFFYGCFHLANTGLFLSRSLIWTGFLWTVAGVVSVLANLALIPMHGAIAAALVQFVTFAVMAVAVFTVAQRKHHIPIPFARTAVALIALGLSGWVAQIAAWPNSDLLSLFLKMPLLLFAALLSVWILRPTSVYLVFDKLFRLMRIKLLRGNHR